ncbi:hypothetical protein DIPPA_15246 [Diplonema papillatum]|nr:hypothetical protein DIPPA_15246 [Diplonema papillatum]
MDASHEKKLPKQYYNPRTVDPDGLTEEQQAADNTARGWLGQQMRVTLLDDRVLVGKVICIDGSGNLILEDVTEQATKVLTPPGGVSTNHTTTARHRPGVIIPRDKAKRVQLARGYEEFLRKLAEAEKTAADQARPIDLSIVGQPVRPMGGDALD